MLIKGEKNNYLLVIFVLVCPENLVVERLHGVAGIGPVKAVSVQHFQCVQSPADGHAWTWEFSEPLQGPKEAKAAQCETHYYAAHKKCF